VSAVAAETERGRKRVCSREDSARMRLHLIPCT